MQNNDMLTNNGSIMMNQTQNGSPKYAYLQDNEEIKRKNNQLEDERQQIYSKNQFMRGDVNIPRITQESETQHEDICDSDQQLRRQINKRDPKPKEDSELMDLNNRIRSTHFDQSNHRTLLDDVIQYNEQLNQTIKKFDSVLLQNGSPPSQRFNSPKRTGTQTTILNNPLDMMDPKSNFQDIPEPDDSANFFRKPKISNSILPLYLKPENNNNNSQFVDESMPFFVPFDKQGRPLKRSTQLAYAPFDSSSRLQDATNAIQTQLNREQYLNMHKKNNSLDLMQEQSGSFSDLQRGPNPQIYDQSVESILNEKNFRNIPGYNINSSSIESNLIHRFAVPYHNQPKYLSSTLSNKPLNNSFDSNSRRDLTVTPKSISNFFDMDDGKSTIQNNDNYNSTFNSNKEQQHLETQFMFVKQQNNEEDQFLSSREFTKRNNYNVNSNNNPYAPPTPLQLNRPSAAPVKEMQMINTGKINAKDLLQNNNLNPESTFFRISTPNQKRNQFSSSVPKQRYDYRLESLYPDKQMIQVLPIPGGDRMLLVENDLQSPPTIQEPLTARRTGFPNNALISANNQLNSANTIKKYDNNDISMRIPSTASAAAPPLMPMNSSRYATPRERDQTAYVIFPAVGQHQKQSIILPYEPTDDRGDCLLRTQNEFSKHQCTGCAKSPEKDSYTSYSRRPNALVDNKFAGIQYSNNGSPRKNNLPDPIRPAALQYSTPYNIQHPLVQNNQQLPTYNFEEIPNEMINRRITNQSRGKTPRSQLKSLEQANEILTERNRRSSPVNMYNFDEKETSNLQNENQIHNINPYGLPQSQKAEITFLNPSDFATRNSFNQHNNSIENENNRNYRPY